MLDMHAKHQPIDLITLIEELKNRNKLDDVGGVSYVTLLANIVPTSANALYHARIVVNNALLRQLGESGAAITALSFEKEEDIQSLIDRAEQTLHSVSLRKHGKAFVPIHDILTHTDIDIQPAFSYITGLDCFAYTSGTIYNDDSYVFTTKIENNSFNAVNLQLLDAATGKYLGPIRSVQSTGTCHGGFILKNETGWYTIRLKGNTNLRDEDIDILTYLMKGKKYYYSFDVDELSKKRIVIKNYHFYGPRSQQVSSYITGPDCFAYSGGAIYNAADDSYLFTTEIENNNFNAVVLQLLDATTGKYLGNIRSVQLTGTCHGGFNHKNETGWYAIRLKGNTKIRDEYIDVLLYLEKGKQYCYSFNVNELSAKQIVLKNYEIFGTEPANVDKKEMKDKLENWKKRNNLR